MHRASIGSSGYSTLTVVFRVVVVFVACVTVFLLLWEPQVEGRNVEATQFQIYFNDPFLAYIYFVFVFFFVALYQAYILSGLVGKGDMPSSRAMQALRVITYSAALFAVGVSAAVAYIALSHSADEDSAGGVVVGLGMVAVAVCVAAVAAVYERTMRRQVQ